MHDALNALGVRGVDARDLPALVARPDVLLLDVRQTLEHEEWRLVDSASVPYAIPDPNVARRVVGYAVSIKGGLKVRNPAFVDETRAAVESAETETSIAIDRIVLIDTKGGDLDAEPVRAGSSGVYDPTDSACLRAAFELTQSGDFPAARVAYARGGLPAAIEDAGMAYESAKWGAFLSWLDRTGRGETRRLLMYSRLLPDPTNLPGVVGQGAVFFIVGLAYYDVGGGRDVGGGARPGGVRAPARVRRGVRWGGEARRGGKGGRASDEKGGAFPTHQVGGEFRYV